MTGFKGVSDGNAASLEIGPMHIGGLEKTGKQYTEQMHRLILNAPRGGRSRSY